MSAGIRALVTVVIVILACHLGYRIITSNPGPFLEDDSYFYAQIAYNIGVHHRSSFDMLHPTDGYHLLWGGMLSATAWLLSFLTLTKDVHLTAMLSLYFVLMLVVAARFGKTPFEKAVLFVVGISCAYLMESAVLILLLLTVLRYVLDDQPPDGVVSAALLLIPLARIDAALIAGLWLLTPLFERKWRQLVQSGLLLACGIALHFALMYALHGHLTTVSSELKAMHAFDFHHNVMGNLLSATAIRRNMLVGVFFVVASWVSLTSGPNRRAIIGLLAPTLFMGAHIVANGNVKSWYTVPILECYVFITFRYMRPGATRLVTQAAFATFFAYYLLSRFYYLHVNHETATATAAFVEDLRRIVPADQPIYHTDGAGYIGFMSGRNVINADGLVNSHEYADRLRNHALTDYLRENNVKYVITNFPNPNVNECLEYYGGMKVNASRLLLESRANGRPHNDFWSYRLYEVQ